MIRNDDPGTAQAPADLDGVVDQGVEAISDRLPVMDGRGDGPQRPDTGDNRQALILIDADGSNPRRIMDLSRRVVGR